VLRVFSEFCRESLWRSPSSFPARGGSSRIPSNALPWRLELVTIAAVPQVHYGLRRVIQAEWKGRCP